MNNLLDYKTSCFKLISFIYLINLLSQFNYVNTNHHNKLKTPCASSLKLNDCSNLNRQISNHHLTKSSSGYIKNHHHYKLTPSDRLNKKLDVYQFKHYSNSSNETNLLNESLFHRNNNTDLPVSEALVRPVFTLPDAPSLNQSFFLNTSSNLPLKRSNKHLMEDIYGELNGAESKEKISQINSWLAESSKIEIRAPAPKQIASHAKTRKNDVTLSNHKDRNFDKNEETMRTAETKQQSDYIDYEDSSSNDQNSLNKIEKKLIDGKHLASSINNYNSDVTGTSKTPPCATTKGTFYCSYKEDYPASIVAEITKYYKWPLEKLFRDLRQQVMPKLANDNYGGLVCDSITRVIRPGWARNTNNKWLVVINTDEYQQYVTEILCRDANSRCNFIPPCYEATCKQRFNTQKLLVIDPFNKFKGPFLSEFLFASCCVCYIPDSSTRFQHLPDYQSDNSHSLASNLKSIYTKKDEDEKAKIEF